MADEKEPKLINLNSPLIHVVEAGTLHIMVGFTGVFIPNIFKLNHWKEFATKVLSGESGSVVIQGRLPEHRFKFDWGFQSKRLTVTRVNEKDEGPLIIDAAGLPNHRITTVASKVDTREVVYDFKEGIANWEKKTRVSRPS